jgi:hypothetical protein
MRHAKQKAILYFLAAPACAAIALASMLGPLEAARHQGTQGDMIYVVLVLAGAIGAVLALTLGGVAAYHARIETRLLRGEGVLARWHVGTAEWLRFLELDAVLGRRLATMQNRLDPANKILTTELEVIFGHQAVLIDGIVLPLRYWRLPAWPPRKTFELVWLVWREGDPPLLEFHGITVRTVDGDLGITSTRISALRVPVPAAAREAGRAVLTHYATVVPPETTARMRGKFEAHFAAADPGAEPPPPPLAGGTAWSPYRGG